MAVGAPTCPISTAYSLISQDLSKLKGVIELMTPSLALRRRRARLRPRAGAGEVARHRPHRRRRDGGEGGATPFCELARTPVSADARAARAARRPDSIGQVPAHLRLDRPSQGRRQHPAHVVLVPCDAARGAAVLQGEPPVLVEWLPWAHTFGSNSSFGLILYNGGTFYIDEGRPTPAGIGDDASTTCARSRRRSSSTCRRDSRSCCRICKPTRICANLLLPHRMFFYAGAGLSPADFRRLLRAFRDRGTGPPHPGDHVARFHRDRPRRDHQRHGPIGPASSACRIAASS